MSLYSELLVFKDTYSLILAVYAITKEFPREYKYSLGQEMKRDAMTLVRSIYRANRSRSKKEFLEEFLEGFFMHIDKPLLNRRLHDFIEEQYFGDDKLIVMRLCRQIIDRDPTRDCLIKGKRIYISNRTKGNCWQAIERHNAVVNGHRPSENEIRAFQASVNSYFGLMRPYRAYNIKKKMKRRFSGYWWNHIVIRKGYVSLRRRPVRKPPDTFTLRRRPPRCRTDNAGNLQGRSAAPPVLARHRTDNAGILQGRSAAPLGLSRCRTDNAGILQGRSAAPPVLARCRTDNALRQEMEWKILT